jgi:hypothetical protein
VDDGGPAGQQKTATLPQKPMAIADIGRKRNEDAPNREICVPSTRLLSTPAWGKYSAIRTFPLWNTSCAALRPLAAAVARDPPSARPGVAQRDHEHHPG